MGRINRFSYCQYLLSSQVNYTITNMADHMPGVSHDRVNRHMRRERYSPRLVREHVATDIVQSKNGRILFDDSVIDKGYSDNIECVRYQYSGNAHAVIKGIGVINCVYVNPDTGQFWIIDYRIYDPDRDGKSKLDHVSEMLDNVVYSRNLNFTTVLFDTWYATTDFIMKCANLGKIYYCPIKKNRMIDDSGGQEAYKKAEDVKWTQDELKHGKVIKIRKFPKDYKVKLFRVSMSTHRTEYIVTNNMSGQTVDAVQDEYGMRWKVEEFHREVKQLTGIGECQCRSGRIQRNHIACAMLVWLCLKRVAYKTNTTIYKVKKCLLDKYLSLELASPQIAFA